MPLTLLPHSPPDSKSYLHLCLGVHIRFLPGWSGKKLSVHTMHVSLAKQVSLNQSLLKYNKAESRHFRENWSPSKYLLDLQYCWFFGFPFALLCEKI